MIGVVGPGARAEELAASIDGVEFAAGTVDEVLAAGPEVVVAVGEPAASALVDAGVDVPVLPVGAGPGLESVSPERAGAVLETGTASGFHIRERPVLEASIDGTTCGRGLFDAMLVTSEPARISEYAVGSAGWAERFRADGVVVSTPAGSFGYSRAVGGPVLDPGAGSLAVVPVAAFALRSTVRVVDAEAILEVSVERDEGDVTLLVDGGERGHVPARHPVTIEVSGSVETVIDPGQ